MSAHVTRCGLRRTDPVHVPSRLWLVTVLVAVGACGSVSEPGSAVPEIAVHSSLGGTEYVQAAAVATIVEKHTSMRAFAEPTRSHVSAMPLFQEQALDFIFVSQAEIHLANRGTEYYKPVGPTPMRIVAAGTEIMFSLFTSPDTGIATIEDLAGHKVMWDTKTVGVFYWAGKYLLDYYDLHDRIVSIPSPAPVDRAEALRAGQVHAYACSTQFQAMEIIRNSVGLRMLDIPADAAAWVHEQYPALYAAICPAGYNGGMVTRDVPVLAASTALQARADLDDEIVYEVLTAIYNHFDEFAASHPTLQAMSLERAVSLNSINPYHAGAIRFYTDRGVWSPDATAMQQRLLGELDAMR